MDEQDDLTSEQVDELRNDLVALRETLSTAVEADEEASKPVQLDQSSVGRLSRMDAMQVQQMAKASLRAHQLRLRAMERKVPGQATATKSGPNWPKRLSLPQPICHSM